MDRYGAGCRETKRSQTAWKADSKERKNRGNCRPRLAVLSKTDALQVTRLPLLSLPYQSRMQQNLHLAKWTCVREERQLWDHQDEVQALGLVQPPSDHRPVCFCFAVETPYVRKSQSKGDEAGVRGDVDDLPTAQADIPHCHQERHFRGEHLKCKIVPG